MSLQPEGGTFVTGSTWLRSEALEKPYFRFELGDACIHVLPEGIFTADPKGIFGDSGLLDPGSADAEVARSQHLKADGSLADKFMFGSMLVQVDGKNVLLDTGLGEVEPPQSLPIGSDGSRRSPHRLPDTMQQYANVEPGDVDFVIHSHLHPDHIGWNVRYPPGGPSGQPVATFESAEHVIQRAEWSWPAKHFACPWRDQWELKCKPLEPRGMVKLLDGDTVFLPSVSIVTTFGHTPGHQCVRIESRGQVAFYIGDALHTVPQITWPEFSPIFDCCRWPLAKARGTERPAMATDASVEARRALLRRIHAESAVVLSPHLPFPGIGRLRDIGDGRFAWLPVEMLTEELNPAKRQKTG
mmetsp:Transcript_62801/g.101745  ORF Transcript_62801/g.101745 Transcript_62801/m.101745 type:complete len:356 (+) Transcript_62801:90-1157(+)